MNVTYIKSATVVIEHKGVKVLCDPWLTDGIYYGSWFHWPPLKVTAADFADINYIYISHIHPDHCDEATLKDLPKHVPVLICEYHEKFLLRRLKALGFETVIEVPNRGTHALGPDFQIEIIAGDDSDSGRFARVYGLERMPYYDKSRNLDSMAIFSSEKHVVINSNDVPVQLIAPSFDYIKDKYRHVDLLLVSYAGAGPFPQAYALPNEEKLNHSITAAYTFIGATLCYIDLLKPRYYIPYAGQYTLGGKVWSLNQYKGTMEIDELILDLVPVIRGKGQTSEMVILDTGESFDVDKSQASKPSTPVDLMGRDRYIREVLPSKLFDYEHDEPVKEDFTDKLKLARETLWTKQEEFRYFDSSDVYIDVGHGHYYKLNFANKDIKKVDRTEANKNMILATMDSRLLNRILDRRANWNNAEIGSHIKLYDGIAPDSPQSYYPMPHFILSYLQCPFKQAKIDLPLKEAAGRI